MSGTSKQLNRAQILAWLTAEPGMSTAELANRAGFLRAYMSERLRVLEDDGFIRRQQLTNTATGRVHSCWFVRPDHPPVGRKRRPCLPRVREHLVPAPHREQIRANEQIVRVCRAPDHDTSIVSQALAGLPPLQVAWMAGRGEA